ncbi:MAG: PAS domain S-box protein [Balneolaceae bacterium]
MSKSSENISDAVENLLPELTRQIFLANSYHSALGETLHILTRLTKPDYAECRSKSSKSTNWFIAHTHAGPEIDEHTLPAGGLYVSGREFFKPSLEVVDEVWIANLSRSDDTTLPEPLLQSDTLNALCLHVAYSSGRNDLFRFIFRKDPVQLTHLKSVLTALLPELKIRLQQKYRTKTIRNSEQRFRTLFMEDLNPSFIAAPDGQIKECNLAFINLFGFKSRKAALESNLNERFTNFMHQVFFWETLQRNEQINNQEMPATSADGRNVYTIVKATGTYDHNSNLAEVVGYIQDITNRKEIEVALRKSEERYRSLIETTNDWIWEIDDNFRFTYSSLKVQTILGYERTNVIGQSIFDLIAANKRKAVQDEFSELALHQEAFVGKEFSFENADGDVTIFETSGIPLFDNSGIFLGYRGIAKDITERKKTELQIARMNDELENTVVERTKMLRIANKELEAFSYSVSHDLRAPLRSIDGFSQALIEDYGNELDEIAQNYLSRVRSAAQKMSTLIDDMIKLAKVSRTELAKKTISLTEIAESIAEMLREQDPDRTARFHIEENLVVTGDKNLMKVALQNLMGNAWKFTSKAEETIIEVGKTTIKGETVYFVRDNGAGFDMNYAKKLFTPFQRLHKESDFPGTGIGLSTVQRIIHRHLGKIWAEGDVGKGAVFYFSMKPNAKNPVD